MTDATCKERIAGEYRSTMKTLKTLWKAYQRGEEDTEDGSFLEYGLSFDYVAAGTFNNQKIGYFRYQISWGGPSEEFRFFTDPDFNIQKIEYWFLDWFDGARKLLRGKDKELLIEIFDWFKEVGSVESEHEKALAE